MYYILYLNIIKNNSKKLKDNNSIYININMINNYPPLNVKLKEKIYEKSDNTIEIFKTRKI
jgi:hypothetical protein